MTATAPEQAAAYPDDEIRAWAKSTGRKVPVRGPVGAAVRAEYEQLAGQLGGPPPMDAGDPPLGGAEKPAERPKPATPERKPRAVPQPQPGMLGRARAWFNGATTTADSKGRKVTTPKPKADRPRTPVTRVIERAWGQVSNIAEHWNVPVARTMEWQAPYIGLVAEDVIKGTPLDKLLQPIARAEGSISGVGSMIAMPFLVAAITSDKNDPDLHGLAAVAKQQFLQAALDECIDSQLEMFGSRDLAARIVKSAEQQSARADEIGRVKAMLFAAMPGPVEVPDDATPAQMQAAQQLAAQNAQRERDLRNAAAAVSFMPPPGLPDNRGLAAEQAAARMAESGAAAAAAEAAALGTLRM